MKLIARSSLILAVFFGIDKVLAFVRQLLVARQFSLSYELDVFNAANNIPDLLSALISGGALGVALIPILSEYLENQGKKAAWDIFSRILNLAFIITAIIATFIVLFAPWLVDHIIAPGFPEAQKSLTVELMRLDLFAIIIFSVSGLVMASLQANQHFLLPALAPTLYNIGQIFGVGILSPENGFQLGPIQLPAFGLGIHGLVYGVIIGAFLHLLIQIPGLIRFQFRWHPRIGLNHPGVRKVLRLLGPRVLTMFFIQLFFIIRDNLASGLGEGAVTSLNLGWFIMQVPETLLGTTFAIALLPSISEVFVQGDLALFKELVNKAIRILLAFSIPSAILLAIGIEPLVEYAFDFDPQGTQMVISAARMYLLGLTGHTLLEIASRSFYAQQNARTPLFAAALNAILYFILAKFLSNNMGSQGIALANSIAFTTEALLLLFLLRKIFPEILRIDKTILRIIFSTSISAVGLFLLIRFSPIHPLITSLVGMCLGFALVIPFILPEIKALISLGSRE
ncbi:MAG: murein biosynthesis integral membrane protein MurJ [Anaerolineaceae bacterium]|nr:murein biosynthesis integral membrane protein MurJ [Anaerolineaceae bacterium]